MIEHFRFNVEQWRNAVVPPIEAPADADVRIVLDSSFTAAESSDKSALVCGFLQEDPEGINGNTLVVLDGRSSRWKGGALADAAADFCELWKPQRLQIEQIPGTDLLRDLISLKCEQRNITTPRIKMLVPVNRKGAKNRRIMRLNKLVSVTPPHIQICNRPFIWNLFDEVEKFIPRPKNRGRQINVLDAIALLAGFR